MHTRRDFLKAASLLAGACALLRPGAVGAVGSLPATRLGIREDYPLPPDWWEVRPPECLFIPDEAGFDCCQVRYWGIDLFHHSYARLTPDLTIDPHDCGHISLEEMIERTRMPAELVRHVQAMMLGYWYCQLTEFSCVGPEVFEVIRSYRGYPRIG